MIKELSTENARLLSLHLMEDRRIVGANTAGIIHLKFVTSLNHFHFAEFDRFGNTTNTGIQVYMPKGESFWVHGMIYLDPINKPDQWELLESFLEINGHFEDYQQYFEADEPKATLTTGTNLAYPPCTSC